MLVQGGYVGKNKAGKLIFLKKYYDEIGHSPGGAITAIAVAGTSVALSPGNVDWSTAYMNFIVEAQVPIRGADSEGGVYDMNKYSEEGMKAFKKALLSGIQYAVLVRSVFLYYKSKQRFKQTIGKYMASGAWRTDYFALVAAAEQGNVEQHIKQTKDEGIKSTAYRTG